MARCPVCNAPDSLRLTRRAPGPVFQNGRYHSKRAAQACERGPIDIQRCVRCGFAWNEAFDPSIIDYTQDYENAQAHSRAFRAHLDERIERIVMAANDEPVELLEIGAGQGAFLAEVVQALGHTRVRRAVGFDPAYRGGTVPGVEIYPEYFTSETAQKHGLDPDIVFSRHVIEHIPQPLHFLSHLRDGLNDTRPVRLFLETPTNDWIVRGKVHHDLFYEHCTIFSPGSMAVALELAGFQTLNISTCFGGQYLWAEAATAPPLNVEGFAAHEETYVARWRAEVENANGLVWLWGAGAKGATFSILIDADGSRITGVIDTNTEKQGGFIGASGHPILPPQALLEGEPPALVLVMNPIYADEIRATLKDLNLTPRVSVVD